MLALVTDESSDPPAWFAHFVWLDDARDAAFATPDPAKKQAAVQILGETFGYDRVSSMSVGEVDLEEWRWIVSEWARDPRITPPTPNGPHASA